MFIYINKILASLKNKPETLINIVQNGSIIEVPATSETLTCDAFQLKHSSFESVLHGACRNQLVDRAVLPFKIPYGKGLSRLAIKGTADRYSYMLNDAARRCLGV